MDSLSLTFWEAVGLAVLCGGAIGIERELSDKPAGIRTSTLVCLGAMLFVRMGTLLKDPSADPTRVLGQVITGIGFLGAGVILSRGKNVKGVTTASTIWMLAAIGAMIGLDHLAAAFAVTLVVLLILTLFGMLGKWLTRNDPTE